MVHITGYAGRHTIRYVNHILDLFALNFRICRLLFIRQRYGRTLVRRVALEQVYFTCVQALPIIIPIALIIGSMMLIQFSKVSGQYDLGKTTVLLIVRELGPVVTALLVILRSATAVTIEISYMNVLNEVDALEMAGMDPLRIIGLPRMIGIVSALLCLFVIFDLIAIIGGYAVAWMITYISMGDFLAQIAKAITLTDITVGIVKALFFGITITVTCIYHGLSIPQNMMTRIPMKTSRAAVDCFFYCLLINVAISVAFYI
ncbi:MAG: ABC transporter permease [Desulfobacterales bacterium]|nr:ABC transporter permease [Desulfobacterales bacterium]